MVCVNSSSHPPPPSTEANSAAASLASLASPVKINVKCSTLLADLTGEGVEVSESGEVQHHNKEVHEDKE